MPVLDRRIVWKRPEKRQSAPRTRGPALTAEESENVRRAMKIAGMRHGGLVGLAKAIGMRPNTLHNVTGSRHASLTVAFRVARVLAVPLEDILSGAWPAEGCCPLCGKG